MALTLSASHFLPPTKNHVQLSGITNTTAMVGKKKVRFILTQSKTRFWSLIN
jgi:hypothetical protein